MGKLDPGGIDIDVRGAKLARQPLPTQRRRPLPPTPFFGTGAKNGDDPFTRIGNAVGDAFADGRIGDLLSDYGSGLLQGRNWREGLAIGARRSQQMEPYRQERRQRTTDQRKQDEQRRLYAQIFRSWGDEFEPFAAAVEAGGVSPGDAWYKALEFRSKAGEQSQSQQRARANAQFIRDPSIRQAVEAGQLDFKDGLQMDREGQSNFRPLTAAEADSYGLPSPIGYQINGQGNIDSIAGAQTTINNNLPGGEGQYDKTLGENLAKGYISIQENARSGMQTLQTLDIMEQQITDPSFYSGFAAESAILPLKRAAAAMGIDPEGVTSMEAFNSLAKNAALEVMGGSLGTGFSNADRDFVIDQVPNLANTPDGNKQLIEIQRKLAERKIQIAEFAQQYAEQNGGRLDYRFETELAEWAEANPLFGGEEVQGATQGMPTAVNPKTGQRLVLQNGQWVPM